MEKSDLEEGGMGDVVQGGAAAPGELAIL